MIRKLSLLLGVIAVLAVLAGCGVKPPGQKKGVGPGDDDDQPVTMSGSSLDFTWDNKEGVSDVDDNTRQYTYSASSDSRVNEVRFRLLDNGVGLGQVVFRRKTAQPLVITIAYGQGASPPQEVQIVTTAEENAAGTRVSAPNLKITSPASAAVKMKDYEKLGHSLLKHPRKHGKVRTITVDGVVVDSQSGTHGCTLTAAPFTCAVNTASSDKDSRLRISVCRPVNGSCPPPAP